MNRIVEFGLAYRSEVVEAFMAAEAPDATIVVTSRSFDRDELGLEIVLLVALDAAEGGGLSIVAPSRWL